MLAPAAGAGAELNRCSSAGRSSDAEALLDALLAAVLDALLAAGLARRAAVLARVCASRWLAMTAADEAAAFWCEVARACAAASVEALGVAVEVWAPARVAVRCARWVLA